MAAPIESIFIEMALDHLMMITNDSAAPEMRLHCHFARTFLQLAAGEHHWRAVLPLSYLPSFPVEDVAAGDPPKV